MSKNYINLQWSMNIFVIVYNKELTYSRSQVITEILPNILKDQVRTNLINKNSFEILYLIFYPRYITHCKRLYLTRNVFMLFLIY